jgi:hypothetical protein
MDETPIGQDYFNSPDFTDQLKSIIPAKKRPPIKTEVLLKLRQDHGLSYGQIAKLVGYSKRWIIDRIAGLDKDRDNHYIENRSRVLQGIQARLLYSITDDDIKTMPPGSRILGACQLYDKERLETGQSNSNVFIAHAQAETLKPARSILSEIKTLTSSDDSLVGDNPTDE